jgi:hypothetical protein
VVLVRKIKTFYLLPQGVKWLLPKAIFLSVVVKAALVFFPFRIVLRWMGKIKEESEQMPHPKSLALRKEIKKAVELCDRYTFWKTECYTQALAAKILLRGYGLPSTVYIGFCKSDDGTYKGHAWLRSYDLVVTGKASMEEFTVQSFFT